MQTERRVLACSLRQTATTTARPGALKTYLQTYFRRPLIAALCEMKINLLYRALTIFLLYLAFQTGIGCLKYVCHGGHLPIPPTFLFQLFWNPIWSVFAGKDWAHFHLFTRSRTFDINVLGNTH